MTPGRGLHADGRGGRRNALGIGVPNGGANEATCEGRYRQSEKSGLGFADLVRPVNDVRSRPGVASVDTGRICPSSSAG